MRLWLLPSILAWGLVITGYAAPKNWPQWRGPNGDGITQNESVPTNWGESKNLKWKLKLPGPGASSPITWGNQLFLTCYSGYGVSKANGNLQSLMRHVVCVDTKTGKIQWQKDIKAQGNEDQYGGMGVPEHGYATATPATDGKAVYVYLGKTGLIAFDLMAANSGARPPELTPVENVGEPQPAPFYTKARCF